MRHRNGESVSFMLSQFTFPMFPQLPIYQPPQTGKRKIWVGCLLTPLVRIQTWAYESETRHANQSTTDMACVQGTFHATIST